MTLEEEIAKFFESNKKEKFDIIKDKYRDDIKVNKITEWDKLPEPPPYVSMTLEQRRIVDWLAVLYLLSWKGLVLDKEIQAAREYAINMIKDYKGEDWVYKIKGIT